MKTVLITGADRGVGLALVKAFANADFMVFAGKFLSDYSLLERASEENENIIPVTLDVSSDKSIDEAYEFIKTKTDSLDMFVSDAAYMGGPNSSGIKGELPIDYDLLSYSVSTNAYGAMLIINKFLPLFEKGQMKRLCFVSSEVASIVNMRRDSGFRYTMSKAALNMNVRIIYNELFKYGYTFRMYHPGWVRREMPDGTLAETGRISPGATAEIAIKDFLTDRVDEQRLVMTDWHGREWVY